MGDGAGLTRAILDLAGDPASCGRMGERARKAFEAEFSRAIAVAKWKALLDSLRPTTSAATYAERARPGK